MIQGARLIECEDHSSDIREYRVKARDRSLFTSTDLILLALLAVLVLYQLVRYYTFRINALVVIVTAATVVKMVVKRRQVKEESMMVIKDLGIQMKTTYISGYVQYRFIDVNKIQSIIINEGVSLCRVMFYLAIIVKDQQNMLLPFQSIFPRLKPLLTIYRGTRSILYGEDS